MDLTKFLKRNLTKDLAKIGRTQITFTGQTLSTYLVIKDMTKFEHKCDIIYFGAYPEHSCKGSYLD